MSHADLLSLASRFALDGQAVSVEPLGNGNVNATYRIRTDCGASYVLQRLNTVVFNRPDLVMQNLVAVAQHAATRLISDSSEQRPLWQLPRPVKLRNMDAAMPGEHPAHYLLEDQGGVWRVMGFVENAIALDVVADPAVAVEIGRALGHFHVLIHDLPSALLADTLEGFHVTPKYLDRYLSLIGDPSSSPVTLGPRLQHPQARWCSSFIAARQQFVPVLEQALHAGRLQLRPIHGDPKVNNVLLCSVTGCAVAMVDLDTVKPGLLHYDIGDALRSACNPVGEETVDLEAVRFDLDLAAALLRGYLSEAARVLSEDDIAHLYDAIRLLPFELGLRFFTDYLEGDVYFRVDQPCQNLQRAQVQFHLTASIEAQESQIRALIQELCDP
jgi:hypothetical protein